MIFTEYRATQDYLQAALVRHLPEAGEPALIHGSMGLDEKLANIRRFREDARFTVSTEAGGEGLNLHEGCHVLANYDLPWNPSKLVQRIGRLYRYGQQHRVQVFNLHIQDGFDNDALGLMLDRVEVMARDLAAVGGAARPALEAEILGQLLQAIDMEAILERAVSMQLGSSEPEIARAIEEARKAQLLQDEILSFADGFEGVGGGLLGVWFLRWQDKRGEMLEDELIPLWVDARGNVERMPRASFKRLLLEPAVSLSPAPDIDRGRAAEILTTGFEQEARPRVGHDRQPASCHLAAAAECRERE